MDDPRIVRVERAASARAPSGQGSRDEVFAFLGLSPGATVVRFEQRRAFETGGPPNRRHAVSIRVSAAGC